MGEIKGCHFKITIPLECFLFKFLNNCSYMFAVQYYVFAEMVYGLGKLMLLKSVALSSDTETSTVKFN